MGGRGRIRQGIYDGEVGSVVGAVKEGLSGIRAPFLSWGCGEGGLGWEWGSVGGWQGDGWLLGVLTVVWLQSVGMCGCVAGVAGAALEAILVLLLLLLLAVADAVHAVGLHWGEFHALDVHLCQGKNTER